MVRVFNSFERFYMFFSDGQITVEQFLNGRIYTRASGWFPFELTDEVRKEVCEFIANRLYKSHKARKEAADAMYHGRGDSSYFQRFYIEVWNEKPFIGNSLSGEAYNYCKRMFLKSAR